MRRKLSAIEIAEGALLTDIAIVFQLLFWYLPIGGAFFALLIPPVFAILVLRRGFYASLMGLCVALFIAGVLSGLGSAQLMLFEVGAGIFLGVTMKYRLHYIPLILLGATGSALGFFCLTLLNILLLGKPFLDSLLLGLRKGYTTVFALIDFAAPQVGLGSWWHSAYPIFRQIADLTLTYWLVLIYIVNWVFLVPVVIVVYYITTFLVRLLGYDVRPFPDGRINRIIQWCMRLLIRMVLALGLGKYWSVRSLIKEVRRQSMGFGRQKVNS